MRRREGALLVFGMVAMLAAQATAADFSDVWPRLVTRIERAYVLGDASEMRAVRTALQELLGEDLVDDQRSIARYTVAYLNWRLSVLADGVPDDEQDALLEEAVELLGEELADNDAQRGGSRAAGQRLRPADWPVPPERGVPWACGRPARPRGPWTSNRRIPGCYCSPGSASCTRPGCSAAGRTGPKRC